MEQVEESIDATALMARVEQLIDRGRPGAARPLLAASRRSRGGTTTYFGSLVEATPAVKVTKRCKALPPSRASPAAAAAIRLRRATDTGATALPKVRSSDSRRIRCAEPVV